MQFPGLLRENCGCSSSRHSEKRSSYRFSGRPWAVSVLRTIWQKVNREQVCLQMNLELVCKTEACHLPLLRVYFSFLYTVWD